MEENNCVNCGKILAGKYCDECGQRQGVGRISLKTFFEDYLSRLFGMDTNLLRTIRDLTIRPGVVGRRFIEGNRVQYIGPVGYFFLVLTLMLISYSILNIDVQDFINSSNKFFGTEISDDIKVPETLSNRGSQSMVQFQREMAEEMSKNMKLINFMSVPFFAIFGWLFYRRSCLNIFEHSVNVFYVSGHAIFLNIIAIVLYKYAGFNIFGLTLIPHVLYYSWATMGFYQKSGVLFFIKNMLIYVIASIFSALTIGIYVFIFLLR